MLGDRIPERSKVSSISLAARMMFSRHCFILDVETTSEQRSDGSKGKTLTELSPALEMQTL